MRLENKQVIYKNLSLDQEIKGYTLGGTTSSFNGIVKDINAANVTVWAWGNSNLERKISSEAMFMIEMTEAEFNDKYREGAKEVLKNIQNKLNYDELGSHEMWNSWLYGTPYEMAKSCQENHMKIIGHSSDIIPKTSMISGEIYNLGVCVECDDGERIWCHYSTKCLEDLLDRYSELLS